MFTVPSAGKTWANVGAAWLLPAHSQKITLPQIHAMPVGESYKTEKTRRNSMTQHFFLPGPLPSLNEIIAAAKQRSLLVQCPLHFLNREKKVSPFMPRLTGLDLCRYPLFADQSVQCPSGDAESLTNSLCGYQFRITHCLTVSP